MKPNRSLAVYYEKAQTMRLFPIIILIIFAFAAPSIVQAQDYEEADTVSMGILLRKEKSGNIMLHTLGYGIGYRFGTNKTYYRNRMLEFDLLEMRAPNQIRRYNQSFSNSRGFFYGKLNSLYIIRAGIGSQHLINRKPYWGGVEVRAFYFGGLDVGIAKPSYLYIAYYSFDSVSRLLYLERTSLERYNPETHFTGIGINSSNLSDIYGRGPLISGFDKIKLYPGLYFKGGFNFEFSAANDRIKAIEIGAAIDIFPQRIPIMAFKEPNLLFITGYLSFHFGKRYN